MAKEEFIAKLQMVYVGDRNAFNELISVYDNLQQRIDKALTLLKAFGGGEIIIHDVIEILQDEKVDE